MKRITKATITFSLIHFAALAVSFTIAIAMSMDRFDTGDMDASISEHIAGNMTEILMTPAKYLLTIWAGRKIPDSIEWLVFFLNSVLWGFVLALVYTRILKPDKREKERNG
jgi:hypothetical protein